MQSLFSVIAELHAFLDNNHMARRLDIANVPAMIHQNMSATGASPARSTNFSASGSQRRSTLSPMDGTHQVLAVNQERRTSLERLMNATNASFVQKPRVMRVYGERVKLILLIATAGSHFLGLPIYHNHRRPSDQAEDSLVDQVEKQ